jgi:Putative zinc-finger
VDVSADAQCALARVELGVYLLGAIEPAQRAWVGRHLAACPRCRAELAGLAGLPALLRRVPASEVRLLELEGAGPPVPGPPLSVVAGRMSRIRRRRWCRTAVATFAAGIAAATGLQVLHPAAGPPAAGVPRWSVTAAGANPVTGAWAAIQYAAEPWGTELEVRVTGVPAGTRCQLWVTGPRGQVVAAGGWTIAAARPAAWYPASAPFPVASVRGIAVTAAGKVLVTVAAR